MLTTPGTRQGSPMLPESSPCVASFRQLDSARGLTSAEQATSMLTARCCRRSGQQPRGFGRRHTEHLLGRRVDEVHRAHRHRRHGLVATGNGANERSRLRVRRWAEGRAVDRCAPCRPEPVPTSRRFPASLLGRVVCQVRPTSTAVAKAASACPVTLAIEGKV